MTTTPDHIQHHRSKDISLPGNWSFWYRPSLLSPGCAYLGQKKNSPIGKLESGCLGGSQRASDLDLPRGLELRLPVESNNTRIYPSSPSRPSSAQSEISIFKKRVPLTIFQVYNFFLAVEAMGISKECSVCTCGYGRCPPMFHARPFSRPLSLDFPLSKALLPFTMVNHPRITTERRKKSWKSSANRLLVFMRWMICKSFMGIREVCEVLCNLVEGVLFHSHWK